MVRSFSHGWGIFPKRMVASAAVMPTLRSRQASRGYSTSQPQPIASASTRWQASRANARHPPRLTPPGPAGYSLLALAVIKRLLG